MSNIAFRLSIVVVLFSQQRIHFEPQSDLLFSNGLPDSQFNFPLAIVDEIDPSNRDENGFIVELSDSHRNYTYTATITPMWHSNTCVSLDIEIMHNNPTLPVGQVIGYQVTAINGV